MGGLCSKSFKAKDASSSENSGELFEFFDNPGCSDMQSSVQEDLTMPQNDSVRTHTSTLANDNDVMIEILLKLPLKSLLRFKCVSKWLNQLTSDPVFMSDYSCRNPQHHVSGFFLQNFQLFELSSRLEFITCAGNVHSLPESSLSFIRDDGGVCVQHSCNGLLLCSTFHSGEEDRNYYICKPTIKQYQQLPGPGCKTVFGMNIAYDPTKTTNFKIICICESKSSEEFHQVMIYESAKRSWRETRNSQLPRSLNMLYNRGVFWNGALHYVSSGDLSFRFDMEAESIIEIPMPTIPNGQRERNLAYFGESGGHLYLIEIYSPQTTRFNVMEMSKDYSGWFVKYHVNLSTLRLARNNLIPHVYDSCKFSVLHIVDGEVGSEDESWMVLQFPGGLVSYNLKEAREGGFYHGSRHEKQLVNKKMELWYSWEDVYPYVNTRCYF